MNNLGSITRALAICGVDVLVSSDPCDFENADSIVLPGVGSFSIAMDRLEGLGLVPALKEAVLVKKKQVLGICLGMQLFANEGCEGGYRAGIGLIEGTVKRLEPHWMGERVPHVGWDEVNYENSSSLFRNIRTGTDFYFVHSYHVVPVDPNVVLAKTPFGGGFVSAIRKENIFGVQFHPEKSMPAGLVLLKNFLTLGST
jgi:glutamine amidotransferase